MKRKAAKIYLIGAGPGDPGLMTIKALECIKTSDVVLYDRLIDKSILKNCKASAVIQYVGKTKGQSLEQGKINELLLSYAKEGKVVARLKGGDPFIFGRGQEEMLFLNNHGVDVEVVPGVSSCYAVPEVCGIPLTYRGISSGFLVVTGHEDPTKEKEHVDWRRVSQFSGTVVIMMGASNLKGITAKLLSYGKNPQTPAAVISSGTTKNEKLVVSNLSDIADKARDLKSPAVCVIGDVVKMGYRLNPALKPLQHKRYLATASEPLNADIANGLERLGASVVRLPMIQITPSKDTDVLDRIIEEIKNFDWLVFTSRHGVYYFLRRYFELEASPANLKGRIACVGSGTAAEFIKHGIPVDLMPEKFTTKNLGLTLAAKGLAGKKVALLRTKLDRDYLKNILVKAGAKITDCMVYNVEERPRQKALAQALKRKTDGIFFLSPKSVEVFFDSITAAMKQKLKKESLFYSIGPVTTRLLKRQGIKEVKAAKVHTVEGLLQLCLEEAL
ncbi:MAG: uroporphyrinogen-III C-methyltransferase [Candidatus Omnitrophica bacterium]|nr:uroporphyrinogen-III C-methyltransferase [Candidatus Omnitrophota bacterium]